MKGKSMQRKDFYLEPVWITLVVLMLTVFNFGLAVGTKNGLSSEERDYILLGLVIGTVVSHCIDSEKQFQLAQSLDKAQRNESEREST